MRVLVATNDLTFSVSLIETLRKRGVDVSTGLSEFYLKQKSFDLIHCQWPEESSGFRSPPDPSVAHRTLDTLDWWHSRTKLVCTVHNLFPHAMAPSDQVTPAYYHEFYRRMHAIGHFTETSLKAVITNFPLLSEAQHFVHGMNLFENLKPLSVGRNVARERLGLGKDDFALGVMGALRSRKELKLLVNGVDGARGTQPRIVFGTNPPISGRPFLRNLQTLQFNRWMVRNKGVRLPATLQDSEMVALLEACDALLLSRNPNQLNSGLLPLAMTFGTPLVVPDYGVFREMLGDTKNSMYLPGDAVSMAEAIYRMNAIDKAKLRSENLLLSEGWGWDKAIDKMLRSVGLG